MGGRGRKRGEGGVITKTASFVDADEQSGVFGRGRCIHLQTPPFFLSEKEGSSLNGML